MYYKKTSLVSPKKLNRYLQAGAIYRNNDIRDYLLKLSKELHSSSSPGELLKAHNSRAANSKHKYSTCSRAPHFQCDHKVQTLRILALNWLKRIVVSTYDHRCSPSKNDSWATSDTMLSNGGRKGSRGRLVPSTRIPTWPNQELHYPLYYTFMFYPSPKMINAITSTFCNDRLISSQ